MDETKRQRPVYKRRRREEDRAFLRPRGIMSIRPEEHNWHLADLPRDVVYNDMPSVEIDLSKPPTMETRHQADTLWSRLALEGRKLTDKRDFFYNLIDAGKQAWHERGVVRYPRHPHKTSRAHLQVIDAVIKAGLFAHHKSPPGSPKTSRLVPLYDVAVVTEIDPWDFDPEQPKQLVILRERGPEKRELPFDPADAIPFKVQHRLEVVNAVNAGCRMTYRPCDEWDDCLVSERRLRPVHYAIFTGDWQHHGRIYTGRYGHQGLRKLERQTIQFDDEPSVELDYSGLHSRMLYHLKHLDFDKDPYALWGPDWGGYPKKPLRLMAKTMVNAAINAKTRKAAVSACNQAMNLRTEDGDWKKGEAAHTARMLLRAARQTQVKFSDIYDLARKFHDPIKDAFGSDAGMKLMNLDGAIALDILFHFASKSVPCLGCHDSFIVPVSMEKELRKVMDIYYRKRLGFQPKVTPLIPSLFCCALQPLMS